MAKCTGIRCPMQYGYKVEECNHTECPYRTEPVTNADRIRAMSNEELGDFLLVIANAIEDFPWDKAIYEKHCKTCPGVILDGTEYHECDYIYGECPHGDTVDWWLKQATTE